MKTTIDLTGIDPLPSGAFRYRLQHQGEVLSGTAPTPALAAQARDEMKRMIIDGELVPSKGATTKSLGPKFLASRSGNRDTANDASRWHNHIATARWAQRDPKSVTRHDGVAWLKSLKSKRAERKKHADPKRRGGRRVERLSVSVRHHCLVLARRYFEWLLEQPEFGLTANPFAGLSVERQDGDEDEGYQETWYLNLREQGAFLATWDDPQLEFDANDRAEKFIAAISMGAMIREGEQWCLHLDDVHVEGADPHIMVRFGSYDPVKRRFRPPKGRKGERKPRRVPLFGLALEAMKTWLTILPTYAKKNPLGLAFPTKRGALRVRPPRTWDLVVETFGVIPRIGRTVWWHLLRHTGASSLVSGWWGKDEHGRPMRWLLEDISPILGHSDVRTTQIYAHLCPAVVQEKAARAHEAYVRGGGGSCHGAVTAQRPAARRALENKGHARSDSNRRHSASKALENAAEFVKAGSYDSAVTALRHVLADVAAERYVVPVDVVRGLTTALDAVLALYAEAAGAGEVSA